MLWAPWEIVGLRVDAQKVIASLLTIIGGWYGWVLWEHQHELERIAQDVAYIRGQLETRTRGISSALQGLATAAETRPPEIDIDALVARLSELESRQGGG